jgi:hypothetical protein
MRKTVTSTVVALSLLGGGAAGVALAAPSIASADDASGSATTTATESPPTWMTDALAKLVADGTLTQAQADAVAAALEAAKPARGPGGPGGPGGRGGPGLSAAASAIGVSADDLRTALQSGQTIAEVAAAHGVDAQVVIDAIVADMQSHLADAVANGRLTQAQADEREAHAVERATDLVNGELPAPPAGGPAGEGGGGTA